MSWLLRILWFWFTQRTEGHLIERAKSQGIGAYLRVLQGSRRLVVLVVITFCILQLAVFALAGAIVSAVFLTDYEFKVKLFILLGVSAVFFMLPLLAFTLIASERIWYKLSGAERMVKELLESGQDQKS